MRQVFMTDLLQEAPRQQRAKAVAGDSSTRQTRARADRRSRVINRMYVRRWALEYANTHRFHKFARVSEAFVNAIEAETKSSIIARVLSHPSKGKTLQ